LRVLRSSLAAIFLAAAACASHQPVRTAAPEPSPAVNELRADLNTIFNSAINERGVWAVDIRSLQTGAHLFDLNAGRLMMPASNMKILTLAVAAGSLGWDYRFSTTLHARGTIAARVLHGDLIVKSNGDPTINTREARGTALFDEWARAL